MTPPTLRPRTRCEPVNQVFSPFFTLKKVLFRGHDFRNNTYRRVLTLSQRTSIDPLCKFNYLIWFLGCRICCCSTLFPNTEKIFSWKAWTCLFFSLLFFLNSFWSASNLIKVFSLESVFLYWSQYYYLKTPELFWKMWDSSSRITILLEDVGFFLKDKIESYAILQHISRNTTP